MKTMNLCVLSASIFLVNTTLEASVIIDFGALADIPNGTSFEGLVEDGFAVSPTDGSWFVGNMFGNPTPSIFGTSDMAVIEVRTESAELFQFLSADVGDAGVGGAGYLIEGFRQNMFQFTILGTIDFGFETIISPDATASIDMLRITMFRNVTSSYNVDNIAVNIVPAPSGLLVFGAMGAIAIRRRR